MSSDETCRLPAGDTDDEVTLIRRMLQAHRIAVVGLSDNPARPSFQVARYLLDVGKEIVPVNPRHGSVLGLKCFGSLEEVPGKIDLVDVFRRPEYCPDVVQSAIGIGAGGVWLQSGIVSPEARGLARQAHIDYIEDRCLMVEYVQLNVRR